jgi:lipopolysaccharide/colanic/teichoic acid biosynthesis glycosyltransferase
MWSSRWRGTLSPEPAGLLAAAAPDLAALGRSRPRQASAVLRGFLDRLIAAVCLVLLAPLIAAVMACIWLETGRPFFFRQTRLGRGGKPFKLLKFRKFGQAPPGPQLPVTLHNDPRLTRVGWFLERSKLDELPQLWNVLKGEMAIVGPRPESLAFQDCFAGPFRAVLDHTPGIFGPSQALFRSEGTLYPRDWEPAAFYRAVLFPAKARLDLAYYPNRTLLRDWGWVLHGTVAVIGFAPISRRAAMIAHETISSIRRIGEPHSPASAHIPDPTSSPRGRTS